MLKTVRVITEKGNWICPRLADYLKNIPGVEVGGSIKSSDSVVYFLPYLMGEFYPKAHIGRKTLAFMTHFTPKSEELYRVLAKSVSAVTCMSDYHEEYLKSFLVKSNVFRVHPPVSPLFKPKRLRVGWFHRHYSDNRKRIDWVKRFASENSDWAEVVYTTQQMTLEGTAMQMQTIDVMLITSEYEAGPMSLLESLACGIPVIIGSGVGMADEFKTNPGVHHYRVDSYDKMVSVLRKMNEPRLALSSSVASFTVQRWVDEHETIFRYLRGIS